MRRIPSIVNQLVLQTIAMPCHTNTNGDIFGGWILSQMDLGAAIIAQNVSRGRVATVAINNVQFKYPILVGDIVSCRGSLFSVGNTSMRIMMECHVQREGQDPDDSNGLPSTKKVTEALFTFVAISPERKPRKIELPEMV
jgi:acyl-CoA thioesterase YciA